MKRKKVVPLPDEEMLDAVELPEGWRWTPLSETVEIFMGQSPPGESYNSTGEGIPLINGPVEFGPTPFSETLRSKFTSKPTKMCKKNDLILCVRGSTTGRINIAGFDSCVGRGVAALRSKESQKFLNYFIHYKERDIFNLGTGSTFPNIQSDKIANISFPLPPLAEQQRIVARVDALLTQVNAACEQLNRVPFVMKRFRQGVLAAAFSGRLTEGWRVENPDVNCVDIPSLALQQKFQKSDFSELELFDLPEKWQWCKLFETVEIIMGQSPPGISYNQTGEGVPLINGPVEFGPTPFSETIRSKFTTQSTKLCKKKDLILCVRGSTTGRINIAGFDACIGRGVAALRSKTDQKYLNLFIHSKENYILSLGIGSTFPNISSDMIANLDFPLPPLAEQHEIVRRVDALFARADAVEREVAAATKRAEALTQAVLAKAFSGRL